LIEQEDEECAKLEQSGIQVPTTVLGKNKKADRFATMSRLALPKAGGTKHDSELLEPFGLDATDPKCWSLEFGVIEGMITELDGME
jgi:oligoendopeptidase F